MKKLTTALLATLLALSTRLLAAEPESAFGLAPSAPPPLAPAAPAAAPSGPGLPLIPDTVQPTEKPTEKPGTSTTPAPKDRTAVAEDRLKHRIELRIARNKAEHEPELQALLVKAYAAPTDYEQRNLFIQYFTLLGDRMGKADPALTKEEIVALKAQFTSPYYQTRISPSVNPDTFRKPHN